MTNVYIVKGSEDGNLGVYTSIQKAYNKVRWYLLFNTTDGNICLDLNLKAVREKMTKSSFITIERNIDNVYAEITRFYLNS